jgi:hypothetical protein
MTIVYPIYFYGGLVGYVCPAEIIPLHIVRAQEPFIFSLSADDLRNSTFVVVATESDQARFIATLPSDLGSKVVDCLNTSGNILLIAAALKPFRAPVVRTEGWHVEPVTKLDDDVGLHDGRELACESKPIV